MEGMTLNRIHLLAALTALKEGGVAHPAATLATPGPCSHTHAQTHPHPGPCCCCLLTLDCSTKPEASFSPQLPAKPTGGSPTTAALKQSHPSCWPPTQGADPLISDYIRTSRRSPSVRPSVHPYIHQSINQSVIPNKALILSPSTLPHMMPLMPLLLSMRSFSYHAFGTFSADCSSHLTNQDRSASCPCERGADKNRVGKPDLTHRLVGVCNGMEPAF